MKRLFCAVLFCPLFVAAQEHGIVFLQNASWQKVLQKAKVENMYIFVDCYASWCGPCKWMDKNVYTNDTVGRAMNGQFLSVQIQMDTTQHDNGEIKNLYSTAHHFGEQYQINVYPSFLFFSPDGRIVHEDVGAMYVKDFIKMTKAAMDPQEQYYTLLTHYQRGDENYSVMPYLAKMARKLRQNQLETAIAQAYTQQYLERLPSDQLWTKDNLKFIGSFSEIIHSDDKVFKQYFQDRKRIDSIMDRPGYSDELINSVIYKGEIVSTFDIAIKAKSEPNWYRIGRIIEKKYNKDYAERGVLKGRMDFYHVTKQWGKYITYFIRWQEGNSMQAIQRDSGGLGTVIFLNNCAWEVFQYSKKERELDTAISWVDLAISMNSGHYYSSLMDTKANLLYKLGKKNEALKLEEQSYRLANNNKDIQGNLEKMKNGLPTWTLE